MFARCFASVLSLIVLTGAPFLAHAQGAPDNRTVLVLLKDVPGAPTPQAVVDYCNTFPHAAAPPLQAFSVKDPVAGDFLLPDRATGDFRTWLNANSHSLRRKLEDYLLPTFASSDDIPEALAALRADPYVAFADVPLATEIHASSSADIGWAAAPWVNGQYGRDSLEVDAAWQITGGGYALIAQIDLGLATQHPSLRQFQGASYVGGNFVLAASKDVGLTGLPSQNGFDPSDLDEAKAMFIPASPCTPIDAMLSPDHIGHGTHVAGLLGANAPSGQGVKGTCKSCGIAAYRTAYLGCYTQVSPPQILPFFNDNSAHRAKVEAVDAGAQALSMSFGVPNTNYNLKCTSYRDHAMCLTLAYAATRSVGLIASSGNRGEQINFPASDSRVIAAGGFQPNLALWNDAPNCPPSPYTGECASNVSHPIGGIYPARQELLGSAKSVLSTTYPDTSWVDQIQCGDPYGTANGDGLGWCTGTSMSAPQIAGLVGVLKSANQLLPMSEPDPPVGTEPGIRTVLAQTASQARMGQSWNPLVGYGIPDAAAATRAVLGKVAGATVRNRATPLFRLRDAYAKDFAETTSPQYARSLMITQAHNYTQPSGTNVGTQPEVPGYAFPYDEDDPLDDEDTYEANPPTPLAAIYVLTTDVRPRNEWPTLVPLHLMDKPKANGRDYLLVTTVADIEGAHANGYNLRTIQGYAYAPCDPEPACIPSGTQALYRACKIADQDCATFLESERAAFEADSYTAAYPPSSPKKLGYAYPATHSDSDNLPDGFELVIGTDPTLPDSDLDGLSDSVEFPLAGIASRDPCAGGVGAMLCPANVIFADGFDGL